MFKQLNRFYYRYAIPVNIVVALSSFLIVFNKPLYFMLYEIHTKEFTESIFYIKIKSINSNCFIQH